MSEAEPELKRNEVITVMHRGTPTRAWLYRLIEASAANRAHIQYEVPGGAGRFSFGLEEEGITWARGHNTEVCAALRAAYNLTGEGDWWR